VDKNDPFAEAIIDLQNKPVVLTSPQDDFFSGFNNT
jgi:hypothetical protein